MGYPLTKFSILHDLASPNIHDSKVQYITEMLSRFKLKGIIIHDGNLHDQFHKKLSETFGRLDFLTGPDFLFFTVIDPPNDWLNRNQGRDYLQAMPESILKGPHDAMKSKDPGLTASSFAIEFGIDFETLPVIILTDDLRSNKFVWIPTCERHIEKQLMEIGIFCSQANEQYIDIEGDQFTTFLNSINLCGNYGYGDLETSLSEALADVLSFVLKETLSPEDRRKLELRIPVIINRLKESILFKKRELKEGSSNENALNNLESLYEKLGIFQAHLSNQFIDDRELFINIEGLESASQNGLRASALVFKTMYLTNQKFIGYSDFTPALVGLTKLFEREINLSIVHWVRSILGVELPNFYNKFQSGVDAKMAPDKKYIGGGEPQLINFNAFKKLNKEEKKWLAPGMGQSEKVVLTLFELQNQLPDNFEINSFKDLLVQWNVIVKARNAAMHVEEAEIDVYRRVEKSLSILDRGGVLKNMFEMKCTLRS